jgi:hypothetical protein
MEFAPDQIEELKTLADGVSVGEEGGFAYLLLPSLQLPAGCSPGKVNALLCPMSRDGYPSRLFFASRVTTAEQRNWNANGIRILERIWYTFSWTVPTGLRLAQLVAAHLKGLR